jgi:hypothetical protein
MFRKAPRAHAPVLIPPPPPVIPPPSMGEPPPVVQETAIGATIPSATLPPAEAPPPAPKPNPFPPSANPPRNNTPPAVRPAPSAPSPAPALGAILTAEKRRQLDAEYVADLGQANQILGRLSGRSLSAEQRDSVSRAQAFIRQAAQFHDRDLATAAELARRARVLTQDLASSLR